MSKDHENYMFQWKVCTLESLQNPEKLHPQTVSPSRNRNSSPWGGPKVSVNHTELATEVSSVGRFVWRTRTDPRDSVRTRPLIRSSNYSYREIHRWQDSSWTVCRAQVCNDSYFWFLKINLSNNVTTWLPLSVRVGCGPKKTLGQKHNAEKRKWQKSREE